MANKNVSKKSKAQSGQANFCQTYFPMANGLEQDVLSP